MSSNILGLELSLLHQTDSSRAQIISSPYKYHLQKYLKFLLDDLITECKLGLRDQHAQEILV